MYFLKFKKISFWFPFEYLYLTYCIPVIFLHAEFTLLIVFWEAS